MTKSLGGKWKPASKMLVEDAEHYVAKNGGKRAKEGETSPRANYVSIGRRRRLSKWNNP